MTATADGTVYFTDAGDLRMVSPSGQISTLARNRAAGAGSVPQGQEWRLVMGLWTDGARNVYVAVYGRREVKRVSAAGRVEVVARSRFPWSPTGGLIAPNGDLWLLESTFANAVRARRIEGFRASGPGKAPRDAETERCRQLLDGATVEVEAAVRLFEAEKPDGGPAIAAAQNVLGLARRARSVLEDARVSPACAYARSEELLYLNHLVPGFEGWLASRERRPPAAYELSSIIRRARTHRERGRARLR